jgi:hypothetical protein
MGDQISRLRQATLPDARHRRGRLEPAAGRGRAAPVLADVERGLWRPHEPEPVEAPAEVPTFHIFASEWIANREPKLRPKTIASYQWQLSAHLLPHFARMRRRSRGAE